MSEHDDLEELLGNLNDIGPLPEMKPSPARSASPKQSNGDIDIPPSKMNLEVIPVDSIIPPEVIIPAIPAAPVAPEEISDELAHQFKGAISRINDITDEIMTNYRTDRVQAQAVISHFFEIIEMGGKIPRVYVEKLPDAIRAKNEIALTPIKLFDSITKFMAASKNNNIMISNTNQQTDFGNLADLLDAAAARDIESSE